MNTIKKVIRWIRIFRYQFSTDKKCLDYYIEKLRKLETLSDSEIIRFKELAENEKRKYEI